MTIIETVASTVNSTKQFVWSNGKMAEARNSTGAITAQYFSRGQTLSGTSYFYTKDNLNSIREMTDISGNIQAQYAYDLFGRTSKMQGSLASDFQYAGYYAHLPSMLNLAVHRTFSSTLGRWMSRDPIGELARIPREPEVMQLGSDTASRVAMPKLPSINQAAITTRSNAFNSNPYEYVNNQPVSMNDPLGLFGCQVCYLFGPYCAASCMCLPEPQKTACLYGCWVTFWWCFWNCDWWDDLPGDPRRGPGSGPGTPT